MTKQKFLAAATAITLATTAVTPIASASTLKDISSHTYKKEITELVKRGVISGYDDNTFKPNKTLTRSDVVKILGKYLVSLGYDIPTDYKTNIRFNDLSKRSNDELLKYAALVKDVGVFNGDQGRLLAGNLLTNEHAANVLVRAFSKIDAFDYIAFVEQQTFFKEFIDTENITGESKHSINVIDYYDVVKRDSFRPKQAITRGAFASMLYNMIEIDKSSTEKNLTVRSIIAVSPTRLTVTLSDSTMHNVYLDEPLQENVSTTVKFTINGEQYSGQATYYTKQLEITDVENINGGQFVVHFNQEVDLPTTYSSNDLAKIFSLTKIGNSIWHDFLKGELSDDKKSFKVTLKSKTALSGTYRLKIEGIRALNGKSLADFDESVYFVTDTTKPVVKSVENVTNTLVKVTFSEPVYTSNSYITYTRANGTTVTGVTARANETTYNGYDNTTEILFDLKNISLTDFTAITARISGLRDLAGNYMSVGDTLLTLRKGGPDGVAPKLQTIEQLGAKQFKLTFNEAMDAIQTYQLEVTGESEYYNIESVERVAEDDKSFIVTVNNYLDGMLTVASSVRYPVKDSTGTTGTFSKNVVFDYDTTRAVVENAETIREDNMLYLYVYFDRNVVVNESATARINGSYTYKETNFKMANPQPATVYKTSDPRVVKIPVKELLKNYDRLDSIVQGQLSFDNVLNEYRQPVDGGYVQFQRKSDTVYNTEILQIQSVETSRTSRDITDSKQIILNFNYPVDNEGVEDLFNYDLRGGYTLKSAKLNIANPRQVILTIDSTITAPVEPYLYVYNLKSQSSMLDMDIFYERVYLNENVAPTFMSYEVTGAKEIKLTFSEALNPVDERSFYIEDATGKGEAAKATIDPTNSSRIILTLDTPLLSNSTMKVRLMPGRTITDLYHNEGTFNELTLYTGRIN